MGYFHFLVQKFVMFCFYSFDLFFYHFIFFGYKRKRELESRFSTSFYLLLKTLPAVAFLTHLIITVSHYTLLFKTISSTTWSNFQIRNLILKLIGMSAPKSCLFQSRFSLLFLHQTYTYKPSPTIYKSLFSLILISV